MLNETMTTVQVSQGFERFYFIMFIAVFIWFALTTLVLLLITKSGAKKGRFIITYVVMTLLFLMALLIGYFNVSSVMSVLKVFG